MWLLAAAGVHAALLSGKWGFLRQDASYSVSAKEGIEVSIVDSAPGVPAEAAAPQTPVAPSAPDLTPAEPTPLPHDPAPVLPPQEPVIPPPPDKTVMPEPDRPKRPEPKPHSPPPKTATARASSAAPRPHPASSSTGAQTSATGATTGAAGARAGGASGGGGENGKPGYLSNPHPPYPEESKMRHEQGVVMLAVSIDERGVVTGVTVSQSSGFPRLDDSAREGVMRWRFRPAKTAGFPVASRLAVPIRFRLSD